MKTAAILFFVLLFSAGAQFPSVQSVYLLPMANGMDQYLANQLTAEGVFQVVTDAKRAQAVFTDRLGEPFELRMAELFPEEPPPTPKQEVKPKQQDKDKDKEKDKDEDEDAATAPAKEAGPPRVSSFSRGRGNIFLVDAKTRTVLWSAYERPRNTMPDELNRTAKRIVERLKSAGRK